MWTWRFFTPLLLPSILCPCTCFAVPEAPCAIPLDDVAVFTGIVLARLPFVYSVHVEEIFSGLPANSKHLFLGSGTPCASFFEVGRKYLFLASKNNRFSNYLYFADRCSASRPVFTATDDIAWLRANSRRKQQTRIYGEVIQNGGWNPLRPLQENDVTIPDAQVTLAGEGKTYTTLTSRDGSYSFAGIPPGHYRISAQKWPWISSPWSSLELRKGRCARLLLHLLPSSPPAKISARSAQRRPGR
ncbi:MAG: carboxypeptidase regulatory-like domain-containing protein [Acidobacteria bacterium]|nr:carboxypeptidase regulatory-like domain-containing protein [Acidobacteriota bacterium]